jgi:hypothetical protein
MICTEQFRLDALGMDFSGCVSSSANLTRDAL